MMSLSDQLIHADTQWISIETDPNLLHLEIERAEAQVALYAGDLNAGDLEACGGDLDICRNSLAYAEGVRDRLLKQGQRLSRARIFKEAQPRSQADMAALKARFEAANRIGTYEVLERITGVWPRLGPRDESWLCCPLPGHEDTNPSFHMAEDGRWHCFGCGRGGGDKVSFVAAYLGSSQMAGLLMLEEVFGR
jgi:hypothetical protein